ncbi:transposase [Nocardia sp. CC227C]|uniref:transposase n=1 Tax=Nocardia sp. CC227C TaxID=3044562 RepID=UPI00278C08B0|nr:transposase [Nocardia sp. CC227C]
MIRLPPYTPDLNPVEGVWSVLKRSIGNLLTTDIDELATIIRSRLRTMQHRTDDLLDGFLAETGLTLDPITP